MDLLIKIQEALNKNGKEKVNEIIDFFKKINYKVDWDEGVPENWISVEGNGGFHCIIGAVIPIIFVINSDVKILEKYNGINDDFLIIEVDDYDENIWEISDMSEFMKISEKLKLSVIEKRFSGKFSTHDFWYNTITS